MSSENDGTGIDRLVSLLGGWPAHFDDYERSHGESLLRYLRRDRLVDEVAFGMVVRYAVHRAAFDKLSVLIVDEKFDATANNFLSGLEQQRAYHENRIAALEKDLLGTPYARVKAGHSAQTSFMDMLDDKFGSEPSKGKSGGSKVTPFRPLTRKGAS